MGQRDHTPIIDAGLPVVVIETFNGEEPTADFINAPEGCLGQSITNVTEVPASLYIILKADTLYRSGEYAPGTSGATIKLRGNSAPRTEKKPYKIKLEKKADLLLRQDNRDHRDRHWALLKEENVTINTPIGFKVNELVGLPWTPSFEFVNLILNGDYKGLYMLCETIRRNPDCRIDIDAQTGYIIENDAYWWNEELSFASASQGTRKRWTFKYPSPDDITPQQVESIQADVNLLEQSIHDGTYTDLLDTCTFAQWLLGHEILATADGAGSNIFMTKYDNSEASKFMLSTMWDFDTIMKNTGFWSNVHYLSDFYFSALLSNRNKAFAKAYVLHWNAVKHQLFNDLFAYLNSLIDTGLGAALQKSREMDLKRWRLRGPSIAENVTQAKAFFSKRREWMEQMMEQIDTIRVGVKNIRTTPASPSLRYYNHQGQPLPAPRRGIIINADLRQSICRP